MVLMHQQFHAVPCFGKLKQQHSQQLVVSEGLGEEFGATWSPQGQADQAVACPWVVLKEPLASWSEVGDQCGRADMKADIWVTYRSHIPTLAEPAHLKVLQDLERPDLLGRLQRSEEAAELYRAPRQRPKDCTTRGACHP